MHLRMELDRALSLIFLLVIGLLILFPPQRLQNSSIVYTLILISISFSSVVILLLLYRPAKNILLKRIPLSFLSLLAFVAFLFLIFLFFQRRNLINAETITMNDFPIDYYNAWYLIKHLIPSFGGVLGYSPYFWAGYPTLHLYPPGISMFCALCSFLSIPISISMRLIIGFILFFFALIPYRLFRYLGHSRAASTTSVLWILSGSVWFQFLELGMISYVLSSILTIPFLLLMFSFTKDPSQEKSKPWDKRILFAAVLLAAILLFHFSLGIVTGLAALEYLFFQALRRDKTKVRRLLCFSLITFCCATLLIAFWAFPVSQIYGGYTISMFETKFAPTLNDLWVWSLSLYGVSLTVGFALILIVGAALSIVRRKQDEIFLLILSLSVLLLVMVTPEIKLTFISDIFMGRFLTLFELLSAVFVSRFFEEAITLIRKVRPPFNPLKLIHGYSALIVVFLVVLLTASICLNDFGKSSDFVHIEDDVSQVFNWIDHYSSNRSRTIVEDISFVRGDNRGWGQGWGGVIALLPVETEKTFIGGYHPQFWYKWSSLASVRDGIAFDVPFWNMNSSYFLKSLKMFNIRYIVLWSEPSKACVRSLINSGFAFEYIITIGRFDLFNFTDASDSFVSANSVSAEYEVVEFEPNEVLVTIRNASKDDCFNVSLYNFPNWHAYLNFSEVQINPTSMLSVNIPASGNYRLEFSWRRSSLEAICDLVSAVTLISIIFLLGATLFPKDTLRRYVNIERITRRVQALATK